MDKMETLIEDHDLLMKKYEGEIKTIRQIKIVTFISSAASSFGILFALGHESSLLYFSVSLAIFVASPITWIAANRAEEKVIRKISMIE